LFALVRSYLGESGVKLLRKLKPFNKGSGNLNVVIDTPKGCRNKYAFDFDINAYKLKTVLPKGAVFPFDFGEHDLEEDMRLDAKTEDLSKIKTARLERSGEISFIKRAT
jgi:hypothetical protein